MGFSLYKGNPEMIRCKAESAITKGQLVALGTQTASATEKRPIIIPLVGASDSDVRTFGVAVESGGTAGDEVLVIPADSICTYLANAAANCDADDVGADNVLAATTQLVTIGASTVMGKKCEIMGFLGLYTDKKYIVKLCNHVFDSEDKTDA
jgi:hypothetical protein